MRVVVTYRASDETGQAVAGARTRVHRRYGHTGLRVFVHHGDWSLGQTE